MVQAVCAKGCQLIQVEGGGRLKRGLVTELGMGPVSHTIQEDQYTLDRRSRFCHGQSKRPLTGRFLRPGTFNRPMVPEQ